MSSVFSSINSIFDNPDMWIYGQKESGFNLNNVMGLISNKKFMVELSGYLKAKVFLMPYKIKINEKQEFRASDFI